MAKHFMWHKNKDMFTLGSIGWNVYEGHLLVMLDFLLWGVDFCVEF